MPSPVRIIVSPAGKAQPFWNAPQGVTDWKSFVSWLRKPETTGGKYARPYSPVSLRAGEKRRRNVNLEHRYMLTLDADAAGPDYLATLRRVWQGAALSHTTANHRDAEPRWRTLIPLDRAATPEEAKTIATHLVNAIGRERFDVIASTSPVAVAYAPAWDDVDYDEQDGPALAVDDYLLVAPSVEWSAADAEGALTVAEFLDTYRPADLDDLPDCAYGRTALDAAAGDLAAAVEGSGVHQAIYHAAARCAEMVSAGCWSTLDVARFEEVALGLRAEQRPEEWGEALANALRKGVGAKTACKQHGAVAFFDETSVLRHVRQAAHSRGVKAPVVLGALLGYVLLRTDPGLLLPPVVGSWASLNLGIALVGDSGASKSTSADVAAELLGYDGDEDVLPIGSGEGMIDAYFDWQEVEGANGRTRQELRLVPEVLRRRMFIVDEGETLRKLADRTGTTLAGFLRTALTGGMLGTTNAKTGGRSRRLPARTYRLVMVADIHPDQADVLLDGDGVGMPQRFLWLPAKDPTLPAAVGDLPQWPGPLRTKPPTNLLDLHYPASIRREVQQANLDREHGGADPRLAHANLTRLKVAQALALLHGEEQITDQWWRLAGVLSDVSLATQDECLARLAQQHQQRVTNRVQAEAHAVEAVDESRFDRAVAGVVEKLRKRQGETLVWGEAKPAYRLTKDLPTEEIIDALRQQPGVSVEVDRARNQGVAYRLRYDG